MKSRLYNADYTPLYIVEVTVSGNEPEYGTPYTNKERHYFSNKEDARRAMMHFFKWERESFYQCEVKIGDDEIYLTVKGCEYGGSNKVCHFLLSESYMFNELPPRYAD